LRDLFATPVRTLMPRPLFAIALHAQIAKKPEGPKYNPRMGTQFLLDRTAWDNGEYLCVSRIRAMPGVTTMFYIKWHRFYSRGKTTWGPEVEDGVIKTETITLVDMSKKYEIVSIDELVAHINDEGYSCKLGHLAVLPAPFQI
jgi:hypothetical protein